VRLLLRRTLLAAFFAVGFSYVAFAGFSVWLLVFMQRSLGLSLRQAGGIGGSVLVVGGLAGALGGGWLADRLLKRTPHAHLLVMIAAFAVSGVFSTLAFVTHTVGIFVVGILIGILALNAVNPAYQALVGTVVAPSLRASGVALVFLAANVFGAVGPAVIGAVSDAMGRNLAAALATTAVTTMALVTLAAGLPAVARGGKHGE
jgi:MFS family permease